MIFCSGCLLQYLCGADEFHKQITHIILDEIHERELSTDILLNIVKKMLAKGNNIKIILMSATVDADMFTSYFGGCPTINIPGRTYEVDILYLGQILIDTEYINSTNANEAECVYENSRQTFDIDHKLLCHLIEHIHKTTTTNESILVFLPGIGSISSQSKLLERVITNCKIHTLHSETKDKNKDDRIFDVTNPLVRKIILSTNIAEASLTIKDVTHVIDCGFSKNIEYDANTDSKQLVLSKISRASANQRAGRVGRTHHGRCYRLYSQHTYDSMISHTTADICRSPLVGTCLRVKSIIKTEKITEFLSNTIEPPPNANVVTSIKLLEIMGALDTNENITEFGRFALKMPVEVKYAKAIIYGIGFRCLETVMYIISMLSAPSHFKIGTTDDERANIAEKRSAFMNNTVSDFHFLWKVYSGYIDRYEKHEYCRTNGLSFTSMDLAKHVFNLIKDRLSTLQYKHTMSKLHYGAINVNGNNWNIVNTCLAASLFPNVCVVECNAKDTTRRELRSRFDEVVNPHHFSTVREKKLKLDSFVIYDEITNISGNVVVRNAAMIPAIVGVLVCGNHCHANTETGVITIGGICQIKVDIAALNLILDVRARVDNLMCDVLEGASTFQMTHEEGRQLAEYLNEIFSF